MSGKRPQRRLLLCMSTSLDGFAGRSDGTMDWLGEKQPHAAYRQHGVAEMRGQTGLLVLGRRSAEQMAQAWPSSSRLEQHPHQRTTERTHS